MRKILYPLLVAATTTLAQDFDNCQRDYLAKVGLSIETQKRMHPSSLDDAYCVFSENRYPTNIVFSQEAWRSSIKFAEKSDIYGNENAYSILEKRLSSRKHVNRVGNESENIKKLKSVDEHMLSIVNYYIDVFEDRNNWFSMNEWFPEGGESAEKGGIVFSRTNGLEVILIDTQWMKDKYEIKSKQTYLQSPIAMYIERIGNIHTHPNVGKARDYAGPGGDLDDGPLFLDGRPAARDDMTTLTKCATTNPLQMDSVISWIDNKTINVDIYFRDITFVNGVPYNKGNSIVVDIGNFKVSK